MSEQSSEPEKYSLDEMMDRLKGRDGEGKSDGELVTRSDGSQAMKVKKRRRRTDQAVNKETKRNQRMQILQITGFAILIAAIGLIAGIGIIYANSTSFRDGLTSTLETASGAKVELKQFRMNPATANSNKVNLEWPGGNALQSLQVLNIVSKIAPASFLGNAFSGEEIVASTGDLILKSPVVGEPVRNSEAATGELPVRFNRYFVPVLNIYFGGEKRSANMLGKTEASLFPGGINGQAELRFNGGLLKAEGWPPLALDRSYIKFRGQDLEVKSLRFGIPVAPNKEDTDRGYINFSGIVQPLNPDATHILGVELSSFRLSYLLGADLGRFFLGRLETAETPESNFLLVTPGSSDSAKLELATTNALDSRIDLSGFKFLPSLAKVLEDRWYELPNFDDGVSMLVSREGDAVELKEFTLEKRGRMAVRGTMRNGEGGQIRGKIRVGIPDGMITSVKNKRIDAMFGQVREGYRWIDLEIGGTSAVPTDNFLDLYNAARVSEEAREADTVSPDSFENLIDPE